MMTKFVKPLTQSEQKKLNKFVKPLIAFAERHRIPLLLAGLDADKKLKTVRLDTITTFSGLWMEKPVRDAIDACFRGF